MGKTDNLETNSSAPVRGSDQSASYLEGNSRSEVVKRSVDLMLHMRGQGDPEATKAASDQVAEALVDHYMDRWRNDKKNGYQTIFSDLGLLNDGETITNLTYDNHPQFRENARSAASFFVNKLAESKMKITPGFLSERVSHGPNHEYRLQLESRVDGHPDDMARRIFHVQLDSEALQSFRKVAGFESRAAVQKERVKDGLKPSESDFWYLVRMGYQRGEIKSREDLARFTLDQMKRYG